MSTLDTHFQTILPFTLLRLEIITSGGLVSQHLFIGALLDLPDMRTFTVGRGSSCTVHIN